MPDRELFSPYSPYDIRSYFTRNKARIRKRWGQNFLTDPNVCRLIAKKIDESYSKGTSLKTCPNVLEAPLRRKAVLEVGPGFGVLTEELLGVGYDVYAVEIDPILFRYLQKKQFPRLQIPQEQDKLWLLQADVLDLFASLPHQHKFPFQNQTLNKARTVSFGAPEKNTESEKNAESEKNTESEKISFLCGNLPYSITTEFFRQLVLLPNICGGVFLVQMEYAKRILSKQKTHSIGIFLQNSGIWKEEKKIKHTAFYPVPQVESVLLEYQAHKTGPQCSFSILEKLLRLCFGSRRKKLQSNWKRDLNRFFPQMKQDDIIRFALECRIDPTVRAEELLPIDFYTLCRKIEGMHQE